MEAEEKTGRVYTAQVASAYDIVMIEKYNKHKEARFLHDLQARNYITAKVKTPIPRICCIINSVVS